MMPLRAQAATIETLQADGDAFRQVLMRRVHTVRSVMQASVTADLIVETLSTFLSVHRLVWLGWLEA